MRYIDKIEALPSTDANNALIIGIAMHTGIEKGVEEAIKTYYNSFPIITDDHVNEAIKLEYLIPKVQEILPEGKFELQIINSDFIGFIDLTSRNEDGSYDIYDFKYSNNVNSYMDSRQLHLYKYYYEKQFNKKIRNLNFVFIPKVNIKQKKTENIISFRKRILEELEASEIKVVQVQFDIEKVIEFYQGIKRVLETKEFPKEPSYLCNWCEYQDYCEKGVDYMLLPENKRRDIQKINKKVVWLYGVPFSGKTFFANKFPDPLMLNTDGNIRFVDAPYIAIKDHVKVEGRQTKRTLAWEIFKDVIAELEKKENDFKTIIVDLLEDTYEHCRLYMYDKLNITHESDDSFSAWDKVRTEFLSTLKRLVNMNYENIILISHEDRSKDITRKSGDKITAIKPNLQDKVATKVAGMVDIVARVVADGDERILSFKTNEVIFGGGRLSVTDKVIPLDYDEFLKVYEESNAIVTGQVTTNKPETQKSNDEEPTEKEEVRSIRTRRVKEEPAEEVEQTDGDFSAQKVQETESQVADTETPEEATEEPAEEKPVRRTRKKRGE
ncbi:MAG TPA: AAA family ATPase [Thermodesulfovibrio thiophilus]|nr:AAA family ATPase [Thermodesulfovibrio thiophilus]